MAAVEDARQQRDSGQSLAQRPGRLAQALRQGCAPPPEVEWLAFTAVPAAAAASSAATLHASQNFAGLQRLRHHRIHHPTHEACAPSRNTVTAWPLAGPEAMCIDV